MKTFFMKVKQKCKNLTCRRRNRVNDWFESNLKCVFWKSETNVVHQYFDLVQTVGHQHRVSPDGAVQRSTRGRDQVTGSTTNKHLVLAVNRAETISCKNIKFSFVSEDSQSTIESKRKPCISITVSYEIKEGRTELIVGTWQLVKRIELYWMVWPLQEFESIWLDEQFALFTGSLFEYAKCLLFLKKKSQNQTWFT